ncbi:MAG TPA: hypothetical protein VHK24_07650 [Steroidobacter sp.]|jgi:hypothetical protein|nr:hypothetical protein [Steroidobacter sp.]
MHHRALAAAVLFVAAPLTQADDLDLGLLLGVQDEFRLLSEDLGAALSYRPVAPGEPLGLLGFDVGIEATATDLENTNVFRLATQSRNAPSYLVIPKLHVHKGLPWRFNVDAVYSAVPSSNIELVGGALGFSILEGGISMPALTLRASATKLSGVDDLDLDTQSIELTVSKGFAMVTPYAGIGRVEVTSEPKGYAALVLREESFYLDKMYVGVNLNLGLLNLAVEGDKTGDANSYSAKFGFRF